MGAICLNHRIKHMPLLPTTMTGTIDDEDESVRIAISALGDMRNSRTERESRFSATSTG